MSKVISIPRASTEKIHQLFGRRVLYNRDDTIAADPTASKTLDPSVKMRVSPSY